MSVVTTVEAEAIQIILTGIDNDIYSSVDACPNTMEMWKLIKRLKQGELIYVQYLETNLYWEFGKFTSRDGELHDLHYSRFYKIMNELVRNQCVEKEIDKLMALISMSFKKIYKPTNNNLRTSSNTRNTNVDNTLRSGKRTRYSEEVGIQLSAEQADSMDYTDDEPKDHELEAHYMYMEKIQERHHLEQHESVNNTYLMEQGDTNITPDSSDMSNNEEEADQDDQMHQKERELLASLIEQMKTETDGSKQTNKKNVASDSTIQKPRSTFRKLYKHVRNTCSWWYTKLTPPGYKWEPKSKTWNVKPNVSLIEIIMFIIDSRCSKHMIGNLKLLVNFVEKFLGTMRFGNNQVAPILGYGDLVQGNVTIKRAWLWHRRLSHLNFDTINLLSKNDIVTGLPKLEFAKDHLCSSYELKKAKHGISEVLIDFLILIQRGLHAQVRTMRTYRGMEFLNKTLHEYFSQEGIEHQTSTARTP
ncbi:retrovirus-related pol polyprotein from transposon TNT 1-94 [Tanacetum coccineum]